MKTVSIDDPARTETAETTLLPRLPRRPMEVVDGASPLSLRTRLAVALGSRLLFTLARTWRVRVYGSRDLLARGGEEARVIIAVWHGQMLPVVWAHRQRTSALVSEHSDGEIIAQIIARLGHHTIRGSTTRGGARAILECVRRLREGDDLAITPDGPRGPRHAFAPGALVVGFRARAPIVPIGIYVDRAWRFHSWDQFELPKPFARVIICYGAPLSVEGRDVRAVSERAGEFAAAMQAVTDRARALANGA